MTPEQAITEHFRFVNETLKPSAYICSEALGGTASATTVKVRDGKTMITDGPFIETKEVMGGFYILDCKDLDEALELAAQIPDAKSSAVEVRPLMRVPDWTYTLAADRERARM